ncbi:hypothetical protein AAFF_G00093130 [Aldrovandia affinis]|uniref:Uncharacterized protein n=1 Tax=Aldrovandia affinis TaxID=143900 RepID=A0AAD7T3W5_9TELE|nr:hypothetical protein AAFF_G00093130 [Aldrovandia affinis]
MLHFRHMRLRKVNIIRCERGPDSLFLLVMRAAAAVSLFPDRQRASGRHESLISRSGFHLLTFKAGTQPIRVHCGGGRMMVPTRNQRVPKPSTGRLPWPEFRSRCGGTC